MNLSLTMYTNHSLLITHTYMLNTTQPKHVNEIYAQH